MGFKLMDVARVEVADKKDRRAFQTAKARAAHSAKMEEIRRYVEECASAAAPAVEREGWILASIRDLVDQGTAYSTEAYEIMVRALRAVRREIACQRSAD